MFRITKENVGRFRIAKRVTEPARAALLRRSPRLAGRLAMAAAAVLPATGFAQQSIIAQPNLLTMENALTQQNGAAPGLPPGLYFGTQLVTGYDSNVARQSPGPNVVASQIDQAAVLAAFDHTYERQHVYFAADVGRNVYRNDPQYDYTSQDLQIGLQSNFPSDFSSNLQFARYATLANQGDFQGQQRNVLTQNRVDGWFRFPLATEWRGVLAAGAGRLRNSEVLDQPTDVNAVQVQAGVRYEAGTANYVNILARSLQARYPEINQLPPGTLLALSPFHDRGIDAETRWRFSGSSQLIGHAGFVSRRSEDAQVSWRNFSGPAYDLSYIWTPGAKARVTFLVLRATGEPGDNDYLSAVKRTVRLTPAYYPTENLQLEAKWEWNSIRYASVPTAAIPPSLVPQLGNLAQFLAPRDDILTGEGAAVVWTPRRWLQLRLSYAREARGSNQGIWSYADRLTLFRLQARI